MIMMDIVLKKAAETQRLFLCPRVFAASSRGVSLIPVARPDRGLVFPLRVRA
ncbi:MAG: hypothetical protein RJA34_10 [Pseudomonadota bacterium]|jgi:hypothetical protein